MPDDTKDPFAGRANQGEGSKTDAKHYNDAATRHARSGQVEREAQHAREALEGTESQELREAEMTGKAHAAEEDPEVELAGSSQTSASDEEEPDAELVGDTDEEAPEVKR